MPNNGCHHLACDEGCQISALLASGMSIRGIAKQLNRSPGTISREIRRNSGSTGYWYKKAHRLATERRREASSVMRFMDEERWCQVRRLMEERGWSPERVSGRLRKVGEPMACFQWICRRIHRDRREGGDLHLHLCRQGRKPRRREGRHSGRGFIPGRIDISERPPVVDEKSRLGDWEADTIIGKGRSGALVSVVERKSKMALLNRVENRSADVAGRALKRLLRPYRDSVHTITTDNGREFAGFADVADSLGAEFHFARP